MAFQIRMIILKIVACVVSCVEVCNGWMPLEACQMHDCQEVNLVGFVRGPELQGQVVKGRARSVPVTTHRLAGSFDTLSIGCFE